MICKTLCKIITVINIHGFSVYAIHCVNLIMYVVHFQVIQTRKSPVFRNTFLRERQSPCLLNNILHYLGFLRWFYIFSDLMPSNPLQKIHPKFRVGKIFVCIWSLSKTCILHSTSEVMLVLGNEASQMWVIFFCWLKITWPFCKCGRRKKGFCLQLHGL